MRQPFFLVSALFFGPMVACSATDKNLYQDGTGGTAASVGAGGDSDGGAGGASVGNAAGGTSAGSFSSGMSSSSSGAGGNVVAEVYGHSPSVLYKLNPLTKQVSVVGPFQGCSSIIDIAIDQNHEIYGAASGGLYRIDKVTAACSLIKAGSYPNSLSFVPVGTLDPAIEVLVGYKGANYIRIDTITGDIMSVGTLGGGLSSSGDIVSVKDGGTYLTVNGSGCNDCIVEVDPKTGALVKNYGSVGHNAVFGLAYWGGSAYGFSNAGKLFEILFMGNTVTTQLINVPSVPGGLQFWGAGSSTIAPVNPPK